jgi:hypothetical protein
MLSYVRLSKSPSIFRSFTGLEVNEFDSLYSKVDRVYDSSEERRLSSSSRKEARKRGSEQAIRSSSPSGIDS